MAASRQLSELQARTEALEAELAALRQSALSEKESLVANLDADNEQLRLLLRVADVEFFHWRPGIEFTASPGYRRLLGIPQSAAVAVDIEAWLESVHPDDRRFLRERWSNPQSGILPSIDYRVVVGNQIRWLRSASIVRRGADGSIAHVTGVSRDVSAEYEAQNSARQLESLLHTSTACIWILDPHGRLVLANAAFCAAFGCDANEVTGFSIDDLCFPEDVDKRAKWARQLLATGALNTIWRIRCLSGEERWLNVDGSTFTRPGERQQFFVFVGTDAKSSQLERMTLIDRHQWLDQILRDARIGALRVDRATMRAELVGAYAELYSQPQPHAVSTEELLALVSPSHRDALRDRLFALLRSGELETIDYPISLPDGTERWLRTHMRMERRDANDSNGVFSAVLLDKTDDYQRIQERENLQRQVFQAQKAESLGVMAGGIAHDLNNMLMAAMGQLNLALAAVKPDSSLGRYLHTVESVMVRMEGLTERMLAYAGKLSNRRAPIDLAELLDSLEPLLRASAGRTVRLRYQIESRPLFVRGDETQFEQVILNFVQNAVDAIGEAQGTVRIRAQSIAAAELRPVNLQWPIASADRYVEISVRDDGPGMDEATARRIFEPFFTTKSTGRGLGLSVVQGIIRESGGSIRLTTEKGIGTEFKLYLPLIDPPPEAAGNPVASTSIAAVPESIEILAIDDDEDVLAITVVMLEQCGYNVSAYLVGNDAIAAFAQQPMRFHAAVIDLTMPEKDGSVVAKELRMVRKELPVLFISGYSKQHAADLCAEDNVTMFLRKPFRIEALSAALTELLHRSA